MTTAKNWIKKLTEDRLLLFFLFTGCVNIGGNGMLIASFANLIAVRLSGEHKIAGLYHKYAIPYLLISVVLVGGWLMIF